jgi:hypothetical protein
LQARLAGGTSIPQASPEDRTLIETARGLIEKVEIILHG